MIHNIINSGLEKKKPEEEEMTDEDKLIYNIKLGILSMQKGDLDKAETILHLALRMAEDIGNFDGVTYVYNVLANLAYERVTGLLNRYLLTDKFIAIETYKVLLGINDIYSVIVRVGYVSH